MNRLLIADDSIELLEVLKIFLESSGFVVRTLGSARNIFEEITDFQPELIIIDVLLSGHNGRDICERIKRDTKLSHIQVLLISASPTMLENYEKCLADECLEKPFDIYVLERKIKSFADQRFIPRLW